MKVPNRRTYPKTVLIKEEFWEVKFYSRSGGDFTDAVGLCDPSEKIIYIKLKQNKYQTLTTFVHEVIHAIQDEYNIKFDKSSAKDHKIVERLEVAVTDFIVNNFME